MCGLAGILTKNARTPDFFKSKVREMLEVSGHRGPDATHVEQFGDCFLGHSRLSIIDLSEEADQPMIFDNLALVFNGEIYNYLEIRETLIELNYTFDTQSDSEVLLKAYHCWGSDCLSRLNGMFAFVIFNMTSNSLFIARDRIGKKPLYYAQDNETFYFCSEIKQLVKTGLIKAEANIKAINEYLVMQYTLDSHTFFQNIHKLMPGHYMEVDKKGVNINCYWSVDNIETDCDFDAQKTKQEIQSTLQNAVDIRLRSDVPLGTYLSSGIDSTIISSLAAQNSEERLSTYTFSSDNSKFDESPLAQKTAEQLNAHNKKSNLELDNFLDLWRHCTYLMDEPSVGYSLIPQYIMSKKVSDYTTVILGGQGGDELFFGYGWHSTLMIISKRDRVRMKFRSLLKLWINYFNILDPKSLYRRIKQIRRLSWANFTKSYFNLWSLNTCAPILRPEIKSDVYKKFDSHLNTKGEHPSLNTIRNFEIKYWLSSLLHVEDRSSMGASIESRCPILDYRVVEKALSIPAAECIDGNINKVFLKNTFSKFIPEWILNKKDKSGYTVPLKDWLQSLEVQDFIKKCHTGERKKFLEQFLPAHFDLNTYKVRQIWMLVSLVIWAEEFQLISRDDN